MVGLKNTKYYALIVIAAKLGIMEFARITETLKLAGGYSWQKIPGAQIKPTDIVIEAV